MKPLTPVFLVWLIALLLAPVNATADGMFVVPKFVWDKHKDINEPTQKAILVYDAGHEDLILQVKYEGPVDEFGWLIPVPNLPTVQKGSMKCFYELSQYTQRHFEGGHTHDGNRAIPAGLGAEGAGVRSEPPVKIIEIRTVGAYEIAVLSTKDSSALAKWLDANRFYFPTNKINVIDGYVKQQWYFVAVKINLSKSDGFQLFAPRQLENRSLSTYLTALKLAGGELNPLQISFASERCVFPLKISSVNGQLSEVQVYVLSPEPLLEEGMLEKKLPLVYSNDVVREERFRKFAGLPQKEGDVHKLGELPLGSYNKLLPFARYDELLPYAKVTKTDLPAFNKINPRLAEKSWWLTKQTWTFKPDEMHDLEFEPALSFFAKLLDSKYGYFAAESLTSFGADGVPMIITAIQSTNPAIRINAAARGNIPRENLLPFLKSADPEFLDWAIAIFLYQKGTMFDNDATFLLQNLHPVARMRGLDVLCWHPEKQSVELALPLLKDPDKLVRSKAAQTLRVLTSQHFTEDQADQWQAWWTINKTNFVF